MIKFILRLLGISNKQNKTHLHKSEVEAINRNKNVDYNMRRRLANEEKTRQQIRDREEQIRASEEKRKIEERRRRENRSSSSSSSTSNYTSAHYDDSSSYGGYSSS